MKIDHLLLTVWLRNPYILSLQANQIIIYPTAFFIFFREQQRLEERENAWHRIFDLAIKNPEVLNFRYIMYCNKINELKLSYSFHILFLTFFFRAQTSCQHVQICLMIIPPYRIESTKCIQMIGNIALIFIDSMMRYFFCGIYFHRGFGKCNAFWSIAS